MKSQMKVAGRSGARVACIVGDEELEQGVVSVRMLHGSDERSQERVARGALVARLGEITRSP
jgi:histidyl-tRNA synthetase